MSPIIYFDFISPYSYLCWEILKREKKLNQFVFKPIILGRIFKHWGQKPITEIEVKKNYLYNKAARVARKLDIPISIPFQHPFNTLYLLRISTLEICQKLDISQEYLLNHLWKWTWSEKIDVANPDVLLEKLKELDLDANKLMDLSFEREFKNVLKSNNQEAISKDVFGVPTISSELGNYWGVDSLDDYFEDKEK